MTEVQLEDLLSAPSAADIGVASAIQGDILLLGAAGKMGPSLARRIRRAMDAAGNTARVITVSRGELEIEGVQHIRCDMLAPGALDTLPDAPNVFYLAARKFGSTGNPSETWAANVLLPGLVSRRYRTSKIVSFSTGNVYPLVPVESGGATEETPMDPVGEYAWSATGRERMFDYAARTYGTPVTLLRLNYACELRYGVLVDLATKIFNEEPVDLSMGYVNVIWQGDANSICFRSLAHCATPPFVLNLTGLETLRVRDLAEKLGDKLRKTPVFVSEPAPTALLNNATLCHGMFGPATVSVDQMIDWIADWISEGGRLLGKPTKFQVRDGRF
ncbi:MAG TPA: NAD-dependent epimerase/dehydratase family protein [Bryobacteraceae bacterium]|nr:NAD-dependent epimerase/dehydratase family protein [Bryobacteraceae bacterium]